MYFIFVLFRKRKAFLIYIAFCIFKQFWEFSSSLSISGLRAHWSHISAVAGLVFLSGLPGWLNSLENVIFLWKSLWNLPASQCLSYVLKITIFFVNWTPVWRWKKRGGVFSFISHTLLLDMCKYLIYLTLTFHVCFFQLMNSENLAFGSGFQIHLRHKLQNFHMSNCPGRQIYCVFLVAIKEHIPFLKIIQESSSERAVLVPLQLFPHWKLGLWLRWTQNSLSKVEEEVEEAFLQVHRGGKLWQRWWKCFQKANTASLLPSHLASAAYPGQLPQVP